MSDAPRVSIITRTRNRPVLLRRAIASALAQTLPSWEMLIVNDGGEPEPVDTLVAEAAAQAQGRVRVIHNASNHGMEAASNLALSHASGEFVVIHDDDDSWQPAFLATCVDHLDHADPSVQGVVTASVRITERLDGDTVTVVGSEPYGGVIASVTLLEMARGNMFPPIAFLYRRAVVETIGGYRADLPVLGDWEFNLRFLRSFDIDPLPQALANYHIRPDTKAGVYSNTVVGGLPLHQKYAARLRNQLLREDMRTGQLGLGFLVNMARMLNDQLWDMRRGQTFDRTLGRLRSQRVLDFVVYGAGVLCRQVITSAQSMGMQVQCVVDRNADLWGSEIEGTEVISLDAALDRGHTVFLVASQTYAKDMRATIEKAAGARGIAVTIAEIDPA